MAYNSTVGNVVQTVTNTYQSFVAYTNLSTNADTTITQLTTSITPKFSNSKVLILASITYDWSRNNSTVSWEERLHQLAKYKKEFGNTNVPQKYKKNEQLGMWVMTQKRQCRLLEEGKHSRIRKDRLLSLKKLGFEWKSSRDVSWEQRLQELADYKEKHEETAVA